MPEVLTPGQEALRRRGVCVVIPTYNNAGTVADVVSRAREQCADVFVVLDGCTDGTEALLLEMPVRRIVLSRNGGKGKALKAGFRAALEAGFAYAITLDADGQHYPEDIPLFLEANRAHPGALIVGERQGLKDAERSGGSRFANAFSNFWFFVQTLRPLRDTQTGYRLYPLRHLHGLSLLTSRYEAELELLVFSAWHGTPLKSLPVRVYYPPREERVSHFRPGRDFLRITLLNTVLCILALVYGLPLTIGRTVYRFLKFFLGFTTFAVVTFFFVTPAVFLYLTFGGKSPRKKEKVHGFIHRLARFAVFRLGWPGLKYTLHNPSGEDFSRPAILLCNHQSHLDILPLLALSPRMVLVTTDWVWKNPFYGYVIRNADYLRASGGPDELIAKARELTARGYIVAGYPEGTRALDGKGIGRFHQGAFVLARELDADILPVVLYGTGRALPKHGRSIRRWPVRIEIGERITPEALLQCGETPREQASRLRKWYRTRFAEIADEMEQHV
jgi:1-acyl-sn-glycerol-3-phosphate acyltransferase